MEMADRSIRSIITEMAIAQYGLPKESMRITFNTPIIDPEEIMLTVANRLGVNISAMLVESCTVGDLISSFETIATQLEQGLDEGSIAMEDEQCDS